ncbi:23553_t:CDS:2 [Gigaspora margarita]|uniref:23553_t:CDS:1 n=1 Tax=Gigaspora margarita TaxID=4874 RepID=A0ABN7VVD1_GIGMA|nr:23553_t:CDS:2 [Gigaspora margarita]
MNQTQAQIIDPVTSEIDWTNKLNEYKNVFALSTEEFKKFAVIQNEKVSGKDKEIAQLLKTDANIKKTSNYGIQELTNKIPNLEAKEHNSSEETEMKAEKMIEAQSASSQNKQRKIVEKDKEYKFKRGCSGSRNQDLETTRNISYKKKGKAKQNDKKTRKEIARDLPAPIVPKGALVVLKEKGSNKELEKGNLEIRKLRKAIKDINRVFQKLQKKGELIDPKDKKDLKTIQELYETNLNIQLGTIDEDINKEELTKLCKKWAKIVYKE